MTRGKYIVLEGPEGVGKTTQIEELARRLQAAGLPVRLFREPDSQSSLTARAIRRITQDPRYPLNTRAEVLLYNAARSQSLDVIRQSVEDGIVCIVDRSYLTTLAVQYYGRGDVTDYQAINDVIKLAVGDNQPDLCIVLDAPAKILYERLSGRYHGERFDNLDEAFLERVRAGYLWEAKQRGFPVVFADSEISKVSDDIWNLVAKELAVRRTTASAAAQPTALKDVLAEKSVSITHTDHPNTETKLQPQESDLLDKPADRPAQPTSSGLEYLRNVATDAEGNVYAFNENLSPITIAAAMARLSRRGDDLRVTLLDEFVGKAEKDEKLLQRVITAYGDDSVQQLAGLHVVVENASNLLTKKLEWGRLAAYLEQSTRYIYFDQKNSEGKYRYYVPPNLDKATKQSYTKAMDYIFDQYSYIVRKLTDHIQAKSSVPKKERDGAWRSATRAQACDAARPLLPVATTSTVGIYGSAQAIESLIMHLVSDDLFEPQETGRALLQQVRKVSPVFFERADKPERGGAWIAYRATTASKMKEIANKYLPDRHSLDVAESVKLVDYWPKNELLAVADMLYEHSSLSLDELQSEVNEWPYDKKTKVFSSYMGERLNRRHRPGRALEKIHYSWDILSDYGSFRDLQRHRMVDDMEWQNLTPRFGYDIPELIEEANLSEEFVSCFDASIKLFSKLQQKQYKLESQYATLLGHKLRWKFTMNAREAFHFIELRSSPQGHPGYRKIAQQIYEKIAEVHPLTAEAMRFVNQDEDPELTRLAAERYTQYKLEQLNN